MTMNLFETIPEASPEDKDRLFATADFIIALSEKARRFGILALEVHTGGGADGTEPPPLTMPARGSDKEGEESLYTRPFAAGGAEETLFRRLLIMVLDAFDPEKIADIARYTVASSREDDVTTLSLMMGAEGILAIQRGDNPRVIAYILAGMMGKNLGEEYCRMTLTD